MVTFEDDPEEQFGDAPDEEDIDLPKVLEDSEQVLKCIRDRTGRFLSQDDFILYVETEEEQEKLRYRFTDDAKEALSDYYDAVHTLCEAQQNFASSTQVLEEKIEDKSVFLDIIQQVQLPAVQVQVRTVQEL